MATSNPYSDSLLMDALRGSLSNAESFGRGFAVAPVGLLGDIEGLLRKGVNFSFGRGGVNVGETPVLPTTEGLLSSIPRMTPRRMETAGMEQIGSAANPRGPVNLGRAVASLPSDVARAGKEFLAAGQPARVVPPSIAREGNPIQSAVVLIGDKIFTGRTHGDALNRAVYEGAVRKEGGKYIYPKGAEVNSDLFMTNSGQIIDRLQASKMFDIGASETAIEKGLMQNKPSSSMTVNQYTEQAQSIKKQREATPAIEYPLAPAGTRYEEFAGNLTYMTPDEFLQKVRPLKLDAESLDNIAALKQHIESGGKLDPLHIYSTGKEDGRHRAYLAKELGIEKVPVALHEQPIQGLLSP